MQEDIYTLDISDDKVRYLANQDTILAELISKIGGIRIHSYTNDFSFIVREIVEQMLSVKTEDNIYHKIVGLCNDNIAPESLLKLSINDLREAGLSRAKSEYLLSIATAVDNKTLNFDLLHSFDDDSVMSELVKIRGIGP